MSVEIVKVFVHNAGIHTADQLASWLLSGALRIWRKDDTEFLSMPLYKMPALGLSLSQSLPWGDLGRWESPSGTVVSLERNDGWIVELKGNIGSTAVDSCPDR